MSTVIGITPDTYLQQEELAQERHEYRNGEVIAMPGGTPNHNEIISLMHGILRQLLRGQPYSIFGSDQRLWIPKTSSFVYPDLIVASRPLNLYPGRKDTITNPLLIAEVLSTSTRSYDRDQKFSAYQTIPTFQEYLLVDQYQIAVEHFLKHQDNEWIYRVYRDPAQTIHLGTVGIPFPVAELYEGIIFEAGEPEPQDLLAKSLLNNDQ